MLCLGRAEIEIAAPVEAIWAVLTDLEQYPQWNPFIPRIDGVLEPEARIELHVALMEGRPVRRDPERILAVVPNSELRWCSLLLPAFLLQSLRVQRLEVVAPQRSRYVTWEEVSGLLAPVIWLYARAHVQRGFTATAKALRQRVESLQA